MSTIEELLNKVASTEPLISAISSWHCSGITRGKRHMLGPIQIEVTGDTATAYSYYWIAEVEMAPKAFSQESRPATVRHYSSAGGRFNVPA